MKKILLSSLCAIALASSANAGAIIDVEAGTGVWMTKSSGDFKYKNGDSIDVADSLGFDKSNNAYFYADIDHFLPIIPNFRLEHQELKDDSTNRTNGSNISFGNINLKNNAFDSGYNLTQTDFIFYWGVPLLNNATAGIVDVNFGLDLKKFNGYVKVKNRTNGNTEKSNLDFTVPMGYLQAKLSPPFIPATLEASIKTISYKSSSLNDMMAKVSIDLPIPLPLIDFRLDVGYKSQKLDISDDLSDDFNGEITNEGVFAGISAKF